MAWEWTSVCIRFSHFYVANKKPGVEAGDIGDGDDIVRQHVQDMSYVYLSLHWSFFLLFFIVTKVKIKKILLVYFQLHTCLFARATDTTHTNYSKRKKKKMSLHLFAHMYVFARSPKGKIININGPKTMTSYKKLSLTEHFFKQIIFFNFL